MAREPVTDDELARARALIEAFELEALQRVDERADRLAMLATLLDDPDLINRQLGRYLAVTAADIQAVAAEVFRPDNRVVLTYMPESGPARPQATTITTSFNIHSAGLAPDGSTVRLDGMEASINWPGIANSLKLNASVDVKDGQKVVVGRIGVAHDQALFLVLTAHVVQ